MKFFEENCRWLTLLAIYNPFFTLVTLSICASLTKGSLVLFYEIPDYSHVVLLLDDCLFVVKVPKLIKLRISFN
jgi:hypothetical protein